MHSTSTRTEKNRQDAVKMRKKDVNFIENPFFIDRFYTECQ